METALAVKEERGLVKIEDYAMNVESLLGQVALIQRVMENVMHEDEHYGKIPGTNKPTLLKPGAEKLCLTFRLNPHYEIIEKVREKKFIAYTVRCDLTHIISQTPIASGIGSCNSMETKYRYRSQNTGKPVPKEYWKDKDPKVLGGTQYSPRKKDGQWVIFEQIENDNPWDLDNTLIKMACKRALVAATLNATAASDIFTQDIEDMPPEILNAEASKPTQEKPIQAEQAPQGEEPPPPEEVSSNLPKVISDPQRKKLWAMIMQKELNSGEGKKFFEWYMGKHPKDCVEIAGELKLTAKGAHDFIDGFDAAFEAFTHE